MRVSLDWIKEFVDPKLPPGKLADVLTMGGLEVEEMEKIGEDTIFELGITPNRGDCLSVIGVAREIATLLKRNLRLPKEKKIKGRGRMRDFINVSVKSPLACPRYTARVIDGVKIGPSPGWMVRMLAACGIRSINNVVDATNYVMLETNQPLHAFDHRFIRGKRIIVSNPRGPLDFVTLDGGTQKIIPSDLLICDGEGPVALAGVMGGKNSEVSDDTTTVVLESAYFEPSSVRRTARRLGLASESSRRFERGVDPTGTLLALNRLTEIILETAGGTATADWVDINPKKFVPKRVKLEAKEIGRVLGIEIKLPEARAILSRLGMKCGAPAKGAMSVAVPAFRPDVTRQIDLIEELARLYGYHRIDETMPSATIEPIVRPRFVLQERAAREALIGCGLTEAVTMGFSDPRDLEPFSSFLPAPIGITNPLSSEESVMRTMLLSGLLRALAVSVSRQRYDVRLFTAGNVYLRPQGGKQEEPLHLAGVLFGKRRVQSWEAAKEMVDFYDVKGAVEAVLKSLGLSKQAVWQRADDHEFLHPGRSAVLLVGNRRVGFAGQLHPEIAAKWDIPGECFVFELEFENLAQMSLTEKPQFSELSKFPFVERDVAILVDDKIPSVEVLKVIQNSGVSLVADVRLFDVYRGKGIEGGRKSIAYTIRYASPERTLTDEEVNSAHQTIVRALETKLNAVLRT